MWAAPHSKECNINTKPGSDGPPGPHDLAAHKNSPSVDAQEWRALWLRCLEAACVQWDRIPYNDLAISGGDPLKLTRLVNLHYELADGEARRQVDTFLRECQPRF